MARPNAGVDGLKLLNSPAPMVPELVIREDNN